MLKNVTPGGRIFNIHSCPGFTSDNKRPIATIHLWWYIWLIYLNDIFYYNIFQWHILTNYFNDMFKWYLSGLSPTVPPKQDERLMWRNWKNLSRFELNHSTIWSCHQHSSCDWICVLKYSHFQADSSYDVAWRWMFLVIFRW